MPQSVVVTICTAIILVMIGVIVSRERRRRAAAIMAMDESTRPAAELICKYGNFRFRWPYGAAQIDIYLILELDIPDRLMGHLETITPTGEIIDYHWEPFAEWCKKFVTEMARAELPPTADGANACRDCGNPVGELHTLDCPRSGVGPFDHPPRKPDVVKVTDTPPPVSP